MSLLAQLSMTMAVRVAALALGLVTNILLARALGPSGLGQFALMMATLSWLMLAGNAGLESANVYLAAKGRWPAGVLAANAAAVAAASSALLGGLVWLATPWLLGSVLRGLPPGLLLTAWMCLPFLLLSGSLQGLLRGVGKLHSWNLLTVANAATVLLGMLWLVALHPGGASAAVGMYGVAALMMSALALALLGRGLRATFRFSWAALRESLSYGAVLQSGNLINFLNYNLGYYLLNLWLTVAQVGQYAVAVALAQRLSVLPSALQLVLFPRLSSLDADAAAAWMPAALRQTAWLLGVGLAALALLGPALIRLCYGPEYASAAPALRALLPGSWFLGLEAILAAYLCSRGRAGLTVLSSLSGLVATVLLSTWLIPRLGTLGAAVSASTAFGLSTVVSFAGYLRVSGNGLGESLMLRRADVTGLWQRVCGISWLPGREGGSP